MERKKISLPTKKEVGFVLLAILFIALSYFNFLDVLNEWARLGLDHSRKSKIYFPNQLLILKDLFIEYFLIWGTAISIVLIFKPKLKSYKEGGLIFGLIAGSIAGLIFGSIAGLIFGLIVGLIVGLIFGLGNEL